MTSHREEYGRWRSAPVAYWAEQAGNIAWFKPPTVTQSLDADGAVRWFPDGELNTCWLALDRHVDAGRGDQIALIHDSPATGAVRRFSYRELRDEVARFAGALADLGVVRGDRVIIYLPVVPEAAIAMLACARLGWKP